MYSKAIKCLGQNIRKCINCKKTSSTNRINRVQKTGIEICKKKYEQVRLVLAVFVSTCLC